MDRNRHAIAPGAIIEHIGEDTVVMLPSTVETIRLSGETARTLRDIEAGIACVDGGLVDDLIALGIVKDSAALSRRSLITAGAFGAVAGISVLAMPTVAMASSRPLAPGGSTGGLVITESKWGWYNYYCGSDRGTNPAAAMWGRQFWVFFEGETSAPAPFGLTVSGGIGQQPYAPTLGDPADGEFWFAQIQDSGAIGKGTPLDGDLQGSFRFDSKDYELVFTFDPGLEITNNCPPE